MTSWVYWENTSCVCVCLSRWDPCHAGWHVHNDAVHELSHAQRIPQGYSGYNPGWQGQINPSLKIFRNLQNMNQQPKKLFMMTWSRDGSLWISPSPSLYHSQRDTQGDYKRAFFSGRPTQGWLVDGISIADPQDFHIYIYIYDIFIYIYIVHNYDDTYCKRRPIQNNNIW